MCHICFKSLNQGKNSLRDHGPFQVLGCFLPSRSIDVVSVLVGKS